MEENEGFQDHPCACRVHPAGCKLSTRCHHLAAAHGNTQFSDDNPFVNRGANIPRGRFDAAGSAHCWQRLDPTRRWHGNGLRTPLTPGQIRALQDFAARTAIGLVRAEDDISERRALNRTWTFRPRSP